MKIGIDLDGVVLDTERYKKVLAEVWDITVLKRNSIKDKTKIKTKERYDWTKQEADEFLSRYYSLPAERINIMPGAKEVIQMLKKEGHELIVITARGAVCEDKKQAEEKLQEQGIIFDRYYWAQVSKLEICQKENIDVYIDDRTNLCKETSQHGIMTLYFRDVNIEKIEESPCLKEVTNWGEIYRYITEK